MPLQTPWEAKLAPRLQKYNRTLNPAEPVSIIIQTPSRSQERVAALLESYQGKIIREIGLVTALEAMLPVSGLKALVHSPAVLKVWENSPVRILPHLSGSGPETKLSAPPGYTGKGVVVAIPDTGIFPHEDLIRPENRLLAWHDLINGKLNPYDDHGHGTFIAGLIAGNGRSARGKQPGLAPEAKLVGIKVLDQQGQGNLADLVLGFEWCLKNQKALKIRVVSLSLGTPAQGGANHDLLSQVTTLATQRELVVCVAVSHSVAWREFSSPGLNPWLLRVGELDQQKVFTKADEPLTDCKGTRGSPGNARPDLVVPAFNFTSLNKGGGYCLQGGPSLSAPIVAGGVALMLQKWPRSSPLRIKRLLLKHAADSGLGKTLQGAGILNLAKLLRRPTPGKREINPVAALSPVPAGQDFAGPLPAPGISKPNWEAGIFARTEAPPRPQPCQVLLNQLLEFLVQQLAEGLPAASQQRATSAAHANPVNLLLKTGLCLLNQDQPDQEQLWSDLTAALSAWMHGVEQPLEQTVAE